MHIRPLGKKVEWLEDFFPKRCRGRLMMRIMDEQLDYETAKMHMPGLEECTHAVLMKMATGEISSGQRGVKMYKPQETHRRPERKSARHEKVRALYAQGMSKPEIARVMGMSRGGVSYLLEID